MTCWAVKANSTTTSFTQNRTETQTILQGILIHVKRQELSPAWKRYQNELDPIATNIGNRLNRQVPVIATRFSLLFLTSNVSL